MQQQVVRLEPLDRQALVAAIKDNMGSRVEFANGCYLHLEPQYGLLWGCTPYGRDWACQAGNQAASVIAKWVAFWNEPRDEHGILMNVAHVPILGAG